MDNQVTENNRNRIFIYVLIGLVIAVSGDTLLFGTNNNTVFINLKYLINVILFIGLSILLILRNMKIDKNALASLFILTFLILTSGFVNDEVSLGYFYKLLIVGLGLLVTTFIPLNIFIVYYDKIMTALASLSLVGYGAYILFNGIINYFPIITNVSNREFYNLFVTYIPNYLYPGVLIRNWGIFREPGVFQIYLVFGLLIQLFILHKPNKYSIIIYIITILTTFSTTSYIALFLVLCGYFISIDKYKKHKRNFLLIFVVTLSIIGTIVYSDQGFERLNSVFEKLDDISHGSTIARFASVIVNMRVFFENPFFGIGFNKLAEVFPYYSLQQTGFITEDNTNMILIQFASHGLFYGTIWIVGCLNLSKKLSFSLKNRYLKTILFFTVFMILFFGENLTWGFFAYVLLFYGLNKQKIKY